MTSVILKQSASKHTQIFMISAPTRVWGEIRCDFRALPPAPTPLGAGGPRKDADFGQK